MFLISTRNFPPDVGGIQNLMEGLSLALLNHGPVKVLAENFDNSEKYDKISKLNVHRVSGLKIFKKYRKANLVNECIENEKVRGVFFDHWKSVENIKSITLKKTTSFCLIHSKEINHPNGTSLNKRMVKALDKVNFIVANSKFTKQLAVNFGINEAKLKVINPGCNYPIEIKTDSRKEAKKIFDSSFPKIITVARLDGRKGHQNVLMTIKNLIPKFPNIKYISIGDGEEKKNLEKLKKELSLDKEVTFINYASEDLKVALLNESDLFLMPSIIYKKSIEGFGISFIEAASYGKGSIGGIQGGEADSIKHGKTGLLCDGNNLSSIYESVTKYFENEAYKKFGKKALEFSKNFHWDKVIKEYINLI